MPIYTGKFYFCQSSTFVHQIIKYFIYHYRHASIPIILEGRDETVDTIKENLRSDLGKVLLSSLFLWSWSFPNTLHSFLLGI